ncbi:Fe-S oxidoreductase [Pseudomonas sp. 21C1]|nr:Fe-S oxidoreductase [Pseudomonas sp. 21C1]
MDNFYTEATPTSPEVDFKFDSHQLAIRGESYPENAAAFYAPITQQLRSYLASLQDTTVTVDIALAYFNSSSTKMLFSIFDALDESAKQGNTIRVNWYFDEEDETIFEFGEELKADFEAIEFNDCPIAV